MVFNEIFDLPTGVLPRHYSALIIGRKGLCKTSFLFRFAYSMASKYQNRKVFFITPNQLDKLPKLAFEGMPAPNAEAIKRITMNYPKSFEELIDYLAKFFTKGLNPSAIIVDDLDEILNRREINNQNGEQKKTYQECLARLMALLLDNVHYVKQTSLPCDLLVATAYRDEKEDFITIRTLAEHFFDQVFRIDRELVFEPACSGFEILTKDDQLKIRLLVGDDVVRVREVSRKKV